MAMKAKLLPYVLESYQKLKAEADLVLVEGAGSASEINLRRYDIANMGFARAADVPVVVVGDIDRGGVIASLVGTKAVLDPEDEKLVVGFIINKFRGDPSLFIPGKEAIVEKTGWPALGFVPYFSDARNLPAEDALALDHAMPRRAGAKLKIAVPILPQIANFDDLDPLQAEPTVDLVRVHPGTALPGDADLVILPGSKTTIAGLNALAQHGLRHRHRRACAARRHGDRAVRRLSDAGADGRRSGRRRRPGGDRAGPGAARCGDGADVREDAGQRRGRDRRRHAVRGLRDAHGRDAGPGLRAAVRHGATASPRARCRRTGG